MSLQLKIFQPHIFVSSACDIHFFLNYVVVISREYATDNRSTVFLLIQHTNYVFVNDNHFFEDVVVKVVLTAKDTLFSFSLPVNVVMEKSLLTSLIK